MGFGLNVGSGFGFGLGFGFGFKFGLEERWHAPLMHRPCGSRPATEGTLALSARPLAGCARGWPAQSKGQRRSEQSNRV